MENLSEFMEKYFFIFFAGVVAWSLLVVLTSIIYRSFKKKPTTRLADTDIQFSEKRASGRSHKSAITKLGGARNCLIIQLGHAGLSIRPAFPFNLMFLPEFYDLEHFIPRPKIRDVKQQLGSSDKSVLIDFENEKGIVQRVELRLRKHDEFLRMLAT